MTDQTPPQQTAAEFWDEQEFRDEYERQRSARNNLEHQSIEDLEGEAVHWGEYDQGHRHLARLILDRKRAAESRKREEQHFDRMINIARWSAVAASGSALAAFILAILAFTD